MKMKSTRTKDHLQTKDNESINPFSAHSEYLALKRSHEIKKG